MIVSGLLAIFAVAAFQGAEPPPSLPLIETGLTAAPMGRTAESADAVTDSAENTKSDRVACRQETKPNSRFTRRVCRKAKDWHRTALAAQSDVNSIQTRTIVNDPGAIDNGN